ncbi:hypothetical protein EDD18DRAFT_1109760 [Armillaria luteobubalina]|uniref:Uncharacterized protein n=1 Tax=Armillaria luteobubalina TaxID=153913 RepID=A0AA39PST6_9AGAR|nr:hypothetical protein EDD18DRAFT_1109760 [Armillaria luteobubalina]
MWVARVWIVRDKDSQLGNGFAQVQFSLSDSPGLTIIYVPLIPLPTQKDSPGVTCGLLAFGKTQRRDHPLKVSDFNATFELRRSRVNDTFISPSTSADRAELGTSLLWVSERMNVSVFNDGDCDVYTRKLQVNNFPILSSKLANRAEEVLSYCDNPGDITIPPPLSLSDDEGQMYIRNIADRTASQRRLSYGDVLEMDSLVASKVLQGQAARRCLLVAASSQDLHKNVYGLLVVAVARSAMRAILRMVIPFFSVHNTDGRLQGGACSWS